MVVIVVMTVYTIFLVQLVLSLKIQNCHLKSGLLLCILFLHTRKVYHHTKLHEIVKLHKRLLGI